MLRIKTKNKMLIWVGPGWKRISICMEMLPDFLVLSDNLILIQDVGDSCLPFAKPDEAIYLIILRLVTNESKIKLN
jgi:FMN phosphatase YigB (HAD superfamily)